MTVTLLDRALKAKRETKRIEFKSELDVASKRDWCELIKDIVALANSGGGVILVGLKNDGTSSGWDASPMLSYDPAKLVDQINSYTGRQFDQFDLSEATKGSQRLAAIIVGSVDIPMVFENPGTYPISGSKQQQGTAFSRGTMFFRHGAKSEPARYEDLVQAVDRVVERRRRVWFKGIRQVIQADPGDTIQVVRPPQTGTEPVLPGRIVGDGSGIPVRPIEADSTWPHRQKDVVKKVNEALVGGTKISSYDVLSVRKRFDIDTKHPEFMYKPFIHSSPQYSDAFISWLVAEFQKDPSFFKKARESTPEAAT